MKLAFWIGDEHLTAEAIGAGVAAVLLIGEGTILALSGQWAP